VTDWRSRERLLRALERGGRVARRGELWGVWRRADLRFACVGHLPDVVVAVLQEDAHLVRAPEGGGRLAWNAPPLGVPVRSSAGVASPLDMVLAGIGDAGRRGRAGVAAQRFHEGVAARALGRGESSDMALGPPASRTLLTELIVLEYTICRIASLRAWSEARTYSSLLAAMDALLGDGEAAGA
jgi:hypothetical protein